jgi:hypothetical protein
MDKKNNVLYLLLICFSFVSFFDSTYSQCIIKYDLNTEIGSGLLHSDKILFTDTISGQIKTYDIIKGNPYNHLKCKKTGKNELGNYTYELSLEDLNKLIPESYRALYNSDRRLLPEDLCKFYSNSTYYVFMETVGFSVICYCFFVGLPEPVAAVSSIKVFNNCGNCIFENNIKINVNQVVITNNGKYLSISYGGCLDEDGGLMPNGYQIINVKTKNIVIEKQRPSLGGSIVVGNLIIYGYDEYKEDHLFTVFEVFDSERMCLYSKKYSMEEWSNFEKYTDKGIQFLSKDNKSTFDSFEEKFNKEIIE